MAQKYTIMVAAVKDVPKDIKNTRKQMAATSHKQMLKIVQEKINQAVKDNS